MRAYPSVLFLAVAIVSSYGCSSSSSGGVGDGGYVAAGGSTGSSGGSAATGGSTGTAGSTPPVACATGTVTFSLTAPSGRESSYCVGNDCIGAWVTVRTAAGADMATTWPCITTCAECAPVACKMSCLAPQPLSASGITQTWDGALYTQSTCGAAVTCVNKSCATAGQYIANMQKAASSGSSASS